MSPARLEVRRSGLACSSNIPINRWPSVRIEKTDVEHYGTYLKEKSRPPSRGGNSGAWHQHVLTIGGEKYSFLAPWSGKLVYKGEAVSFDWEWDASGKYRNADLATVVASKANGEQVW